MHLLKANIFFHKDLEQAAINEYQQAAFMSRTYDLPLLNEIHATLGAAFYKQEAYDKALAYYRLVDTGYAMPANARSAMYSNIAGCYDHLEHFETAELYYKKSIGLQPDTPRLMIAYLNLGALYFNYYDNRRAELYWKKCMRLVTAQTHSRVLENLYYNFFMLSEATGDYRQALDYYKRSDSLRLLLKDREKLWELGQTEKKLAVQAKQLQIAALQTLNSKKELELARRSMQRNALVAASLGLLLIVATVSLFLLQRSKTTRIIRRQNQQLEALNQTKDRLFSIIAHDLRAPVHALQQKNLRAHQRLMQGDHTGAAELIAHIRKDTEQASLLLNNLLHWSFAETGNLLLLPQPLLLRACIEQVCQELSFACLEKNIGIELHIPEQTIVVTDHSSLRITLRNLIQNAVKFSYLNEKIEISSTTNRMSTQIHIRDYGIGIPAGMHASLFSMERSKVRSGTGGEHGSGLGLWLISDLLQKNNGSICVAPQTEPGTEIIITLNHT